MTKLKDLDLVLEIEATGVLAPNSNKPTLRYNFEKEKDWQECNAVTLPVVNVFHLQQAARKWIEHFESGEAHTDFAADGRNGQENVIEWIEHFFNLENEE